MKLNVIKTQKGFTLIELTIVIAIIAILSAATMKGYGWIQSSKVSATVEQLRTIRSASQNWKSVGGAADYSGLGTTTGGVAKLQTLKLLNAADGSNRFGGSNDCGAVSGTPTSLVVTSGTLDVNYGPLVASGANAVFGANTCAYASNTVTCTFAD